MSLLKRLFTTSAVLLLMLSWCFTTSFAQHEKGGPAQFPSKSHYEKHVIHSLLEDWHRAASEADFEQYFNYFASDSAVFMGTDATERWTVAEFKPWAKPYFDRGKAWDFTPTRRNVYFSEDSSTAWFDESLDTPNLGPARGSGVLIQVEEEWRIAHYNLSIPIPNAIVDTVVKQVEAALEDSSNTKP